MLREEIAHRVEAERRRIRSTQADVARILGIVQAAYSRKELGQVWFSVADICKLGELFSVPVNYLITGKTEPKSLLVDEEWRLVRLYRKAPPEGKTAIMDTAVEAIL